MWNGKLNDWVTILETNDIITFILSKDHSMFLMYKKGSGLHFKELINNETGWFVQDTTFYRIMSSEVVKDINGNTVYKFSTRSGLQNEKYLFNYYKNANLLHCIFDDNTGRVVRTRFIIKSGSIK